VVKPSGKPLSQGYFFKMRIAAHNPSVYSGGKYDLVSMADPLVKLFMEGIRTKNT